MLRPQAPSSDAPPLRTWVFFVVPLVTFALASADTLLLAAPRARSTPGHWNVELATTIPLSAAACALTTWILLRLRREFAHRAWTESHLRTALAERGEAIVNLQRGLDREQRLRRELDHRVRNNLSSLLGLVGLYEGASIEPADLVTSLRVRISALREVYGLISGAPDEGVDFTVLLATICGLMTRPRERAAVTSSGPPIRLSGREANALAMIVQELFTNATKHGALSGPGGTVRVTWSAQPDGLDTRLDLRWIETRPDSARGSAPQSGGIGLTLVDGIVRSDLRGRVAFGRANGLWTVSIVAILASPAATSLPPMHQEVHSS